MLDLWDCIIPLLREADEIVCRHLPSMTNAMDTMFSFLLHDLKSVVVKATSGPFLDPTQNAEEMVSTLNHMCAHMHSLGVKLEQLSRNSQNLKGKLSQIMNSNLSFEKMINKLVSTGCYVFLPSIRTSNGFDHFGNRCEDG